MITTMVLLTMLATGGDAASLDTGPRILRKEVTIRASLDQVWHAWTTAEGLGTMKQHLESSDAVTSESE